MSRVTRCVHLCAVLAAVVIAACNGSKRTAPSLKGSLAITVTPSTGVPPRVAISGPDAYTNQITSSTILTGLAIGDYNVSADSTTVPDSVVGSITDTVSITGNPASVQSRDTAHVTVTYALKERTGGLWIANNDNPTIVDYAAAQLRTTSSQTPAETLATTGNTNGANSGTTGLALDPSGNMWLSTINTDTLAMYTRAARDSGAAVASAALHDGTLGGGANDMAFDRQGNLWVADLNGYILKYTAAQLVAGGEQTADVQISSSLSEPWAIAFDDSGNAWVADAANNKLVEFAAGTLSDTGSTCTPAPAQCTPTPVDTVGSNNNSINAPSGLAFDAQGNLWVANGSGSTVVMFTRAQLLSNGAPAPQVIITTPSGSIPNGIAFDNRGSLWVSNALVLLTGSGSMFGFTASQIGTTGAPTPAVTLTSALTNFNPQQMAFDANAAATQLSSSRVRHVVTHPHSQSRGGVNPNIWRLLHHGQKM